MFLFFLVFVLTDIANASLGISEQAVLTFPTKQPAGGASYLRRYPLSNRILDQVQKLDLDVWFRNSTHLDVHFASEEVADSVSGDYLSSTTLPFTGFKQLDPQAGTWNLTTLNNCTFHDDYHPLFEAEMFMFQLAVEFPDLVSLKKIGSSAEGRDMYALEISQKKSCHKKGKKKHPGKGGGKGKKPQKKTKKVKKQRFIVQGAQHAREWVASASALYLAHALVVNSTDPTSLNFLLEHFTFHIVPFPNPDGYDYTWSEDRYWYKNRMSLGPRASCKGLDMNRNWGFQWSPDVFAESVGADLCSHWYPGSRPFEAPETNNMANYVTSIPRKSVFLDLRSYGQMLSSPFSYSCKVLPAEAEDLLEASMGAANAMSKPYGSYVMTGTLCETLYSAPGNVVDWMYSHAKIKYSYAAHLRDTGTYGYALPPTFIRPTGDETLEMVEYLAKFVKAHPPKKI